MIEEILCDVVRHLLWGAWQNRCDLTCCDHATNTWSTGTRWADNVQQKEKQGTVSQWISSWILASCHCRMNPTFRIISYQFQAHHQISMEWLRQGTGRGHREELLWFSHMQLSLSTVAISDVMTKYGIYLNINKLIAILHNLQEYTYKLYNLQECT